VLFADRKAAGRALCAPLEPFRDSDALVLALPRGGVPVAAEVARALGLELGLILVRKVGLPGQPELAVAALAGPEGETLVINSAIARATGLDRARIEALAKPQRAELRRRRALWLGEYPQPSLAGRVVIVVDDGLATGATMRAALTWARAQNPAHLIAAIPVGATDALTDLEAFADTVICPQRPHPFHAVGAHYAQFDQVSDDAVRHLLDAAAKPAA